MLKLANNILFATSLAVTSEALAMGVKAGLDPDIMLEAIPVSYTHLTLPTILLV